MKRLTVTDFAEMTCGNPECTHHGDPELFLHSLCHPETPPWAAYNHLTQALEFSCSVCGERVALVAVALTASTARLTH